MKTLRIIGMTIIAILLSLNFVACSDDDDNKSGANTSLAGTTWKVISVASQDEDWLNLKAFPPLLKAMVQ